MNFGVVRPTLPVSASSQKPVNKTVNNLVPKKLPDHLCPDYDPELGQRINLEGWHYRDIPPKNN